MEKTYIVNGITYSNIEDIPHEEFINSDGITTIQYMNAKQILENYKDKLTKEQIKLLKKYDTRIR